MRGLFSILILAIFFIEPSICQNTPDSLEQLTPVNTLIEIREKANQEIESFKNTFEKQLKLSIYILGGLGGLVITILGVFGSKTIKSASSRWAKQKVEDLATSEFKKWISKDIDNLQQQINRMNYYKSSKILFIGNRGQIKDWETFEMELLKKSGLQKMSSSTEVNHSYLDVDIVIYGYDTRGKDNDEQFKDLLTRLKQVNEHRIPVIIYSSKFQISEHDKAMLVDYQWYAMANMPLTLLGHIYNMARIFYSLNGSLHRSI